MRADSWESGRRPHFMLEIATMFGVKVDDALDVWSCLVQRRMQKETGLVDAKVGGALLLHLPLHVHLDQARGSDLVVHHPKGVEKKVLSVLADSCRNMVVYALAPAVDVNESVDCCKFTPKLLLPLSVD